MLFKRSHVREKTLNCYRNDQALESVYEKVIKNAGICNGENIEEETLINPESS